MVAETAQPMNTMTRSEQSMSILLIFRLKEHTYIIRRRPERRRRRARR